MLVPNWRHHSAKLRKWKRRPQAVRDARHRLKALLRKLRRKHYAHTP